MAETRVKPGSYSRSELQSALLYPNQTSPELQRAVKAVAEQWRAQNSERREEQRKAQTQYRR
jgi:hypothetical protein